MLTDVVLIRKKIVRPIFRFRWLKNWIDLSKTPQIFYSFADESTHTFGAIIFFSLRSLTDR